MTRAHLFACALLLGTGTTAAMADPLYTVDPSGQVHAIEMAPHLMSPEGSIPTPYIAPTPAYDSRQVDRQPSRTYQAPMPTIAPISVDPEMDASSDANDIPHTRRHRHHHRHWGHHTFHRHLRHIHHSS